MPIFNIIEDTDVAPYLLAACALPVNTNPIIINTQARCEQTLTTGTIALLITSGR